MWQLITMLNEAIHDLARSLRDDFAALSKPQDASLGPRPTSSGGLSSWQPARRSLPKGIPPMLIGLDLLILIIGLLMYVLSTNGKLNEIGRIMFFCALFALLLGGDRVVALFGTGVR